MIYLIEDHGQRIKIGFTRKPGGSQTRAYSMRTGNPDNLKVLCEFEGDIATEKAFHDLLAENRVAREWFYGSPRDHRFHHTITLTKMDGAKVLGMDTSEIENFVFLPEFAAGDVRVPNLRAIAIEHKE